MDRPDREACRRYLVFHHLSDLAREPCHRFAEFSENCFPKTPSALKQQQLLNSLKLKVEFPTIILGSFPMYSILSSFQTGKGQNSRMVFDMRHSKGLRSLQILQVEARRPGIFSAAAKTETGGTSFGLLTRCTKYHFRFIGVRRPRIRPL